MNGLRPVLTRLVQDLRPAGIAALALIGLCAGLDALLLRPLEARNAVLMERLGRPAQGRAGVVRISSPAARMQSYYRFFDRPETTTDWLATLHVIGGAVGIELRSAEYRLVETKGRIDRYQISLPVKANYAQIRAFIENALMEIPVLSLDSVAFRKQRVSDAFVEADIKLTLHSLRP